MSAPLTASADAAIAHAEPGLDACHPAWIPAWILVATVCASSLALIDGSVVNVALPSIGRDLGAGNTDLQWTVNAYLLPLSVLLLLGGAAGDRLGRRLTLGPVAAVAGLALLVLADPRASYWSSVLPGVAVFAVGMALAVAPLTVAVLSSVGTHRAGTASGLNSATARTGGLIATALGGAVISSSGPGQLESFHAAAMVGAALALLASVVSFVTLGATSTSSSRPTA